MNQNQTSRTHYEMLGVIPDTDAAAIKAAYRKLVRTVHPDVGGNGALFGLITEGNECLRDPSRRAEYDRYLAAGGDSAPDPRGEEADRAAERVRFEAFLRETAEAAAAGARATRLAKDAARSDPWIRAEAARVEAEQQQRVAAARAAKRTDRRTRHPLRLWLPMGAAVLVGAAASFAMGHFGVTRWVD